MNFLLRHNRTLGCTKKSASWCYQPDPRSLDSIGAGPHGLSRFRHLHGPCFSFQPSFASSQVSACLVCCDPVLRWWKPHFPLRVKTLEGPPKPSYEQLEQDSCINISVETNRGWERKWRSARFYFYISLSRVSTWKEANKQRKIVLKDTHTQNIS